MSKQFTWIEIYQELATVLAGWQDRQPELIAFLEDLRKRGFTITPMTDKNRDGERFPLKEIDPFTFFGVFNRGILDETRIAILAQMKQFFDLNSPVASDFSGIPILNNIKSWFFPYQNIRDTNHVPTLWRVFQLALQEKPLQNEAFLEAFDQSLSFHGVNVNLTMGLFWIRPYTFLNLDRTNREYLNVKIPSGGLTAKFYVRLLQKYTQKGQPFPELSRTAALTVFNTANKKEVPVIVENRSHQKENVNYWLVGAYWSETEPTDQTRRFLDEGIWENGYTDRYSDDVKSMKVNDKIAIKVAFTQRKNLPFDARNETVSRMDIKAIGTIVANRGDGKIVEVEWEPDFQQKTWYFFTNRRTIWRLQTDKDYKFLEFSTNLIDFIWRNKEQNYDWFIEQWWGTEKEIPVGKMIQGPKPYSIDDIIASGVFLEDEELTQILSRLRTKKAMILQGSPGVGKTFLAKKLAYALMEEMDNERLEMVQFHQSYSYDDFVRGYRPLPGQAGSFGLQNGIFYEFCQRVAQDPEREYVFIIDEINRGNLSLIFGELLMLIEADKRGKDFAVPLVYRNPDEPRFFIPANLYLIGLMNLADRSLAMVDYALRRRFAFVTLPPKYSSPLFRQWLENRAMPKDLIALIVSRLDALNAEIKGDSLLGENYQIGHSYFCPKGDDFSQLNQNWYDSIVQTEIAPLLKEYWFDNPQKADNAIQKLLS